MSLLLASTVLDGGDKLEVGEDRGISSSNFLAAFRLGTFVSVLLLLTTLLLLLCFLAFKAGESCSVDVGGDGGEFAGHAAANKRVEKGWISWYPQAGRRH